MKRLLASRWLKVVLAAGVLGALVAFNRIDLRAFAQLSQSWAWLAGAFALMLPPYLVVSCRFWLVLRNQGIAVTPGRALRWTMIGSFFDVMMPGATGGDVVKAAYIVRHVGPGRRTFGVMAVALDRLLGLLGLFLLASVACLAGWGAIRAAPWSHAVALFAVGATLGALVALRLLGARRLTRNERLRAMLGRSRLGAQLLKVAGSFNALRERPADLGAALALSVVNHLFWCAALLCIATAFGAPLSWIEALTVFPLALFGNSFGFAGGFGVGTAAFDVVLSALLGLADGAAIGLTFQGLMALSRLLALPFYLARDR